MRQRLLVEKRIWISLCTLSLFISMCESLCVDKIVNGEVLTYLILM